MKYFNKITGAGSYRVYDLASVEGAGAIFDNFAHEWEKSRFHSYRNIESAQNYRKSRGSVRSILAGLLHLSPDDLHLPAPPAYGMVGDVGFSVSRSGPDAVLAVAEYGGIGVDLVNATPDCAPLDDIIISPADRAAIARCYPGVRQDLCGWAAKEATAKLFNAVDLAPEKWALRAWNRDLLVTNGRQMARVALLPMAGTLVAAIARKRRASDYFPVQQATD